MKLSNVDYKLFFGIIIALISIYALGIERFVLEFLMDYAKFFVLAVVYGIPLTIILLLLLLIYISIKDFNRPATQQVQIKKEYPKVIDDPVKEAKDNAIILAFSLYFAILSSKSVLKTGITINKLISDPTFATLFIFYVLISTLFYYIFALRMVYVTIITVNGVISSFIEFIYSKVRGG